MANDDEAGPMKQPEQPPQAFFDYIITSQDSGPQAQQPLRIKERAANSDNTEGGNTETTDTDGANQTTDGARTKRKQKPRPPNKLGVGRLDVHEVHPGNFDIVSPPEVSGCYGNDLACILRESVNINQKH